MVRVKSSAAAASPPGTRSRKQTETQQQQQAKKRLSNGFLNSSTSSSGSTTNNIRFKYDQITTRSRAANYASSSSATRKRRELQLHNNSIIINNHTNNISNSSSYSATGAELKRLHIAMRLKHEKVNHSLPSPTKTTSTNHQNNRTKGLAASVRSTTNGNSIVSSFRNGLKRSNKNNISPSKTKNENKLNYRQQVLSNYSRKRKLSKSPQNFKHRKRAKDEDITDEDEDDDGTDSENRDRKNRRSALWVLNCEAEEFLFGETAAEKHEVVLPPKSTQPPASKRRRMRATELGDLLKETPLLESKLRKPISPGSENSLLSPTSSVTSEIALMRKRACVKRRILQNDDTATSDDSLYSPGADTEDSSTSELNVSTTSRTTTTTSFSSSSSEVGSPPPDLFSQSVRLQRILRNLQMKFSFENVPSNEVWYQTFSRQESPVKSFQQPESPVILPYERSSLSKRALAMFSKLPRKSPRCHASTLAILSSLKPPRSRLSSTTSASISSASLPHCSSSSTPVSTRSLHLLPTPTTPHSKQCSSSTGPTSLVPLKRRGRHLSSSVTPSPPVLQNSMATCELKATEYVWNAVQFLEDPYVLQLLAEQQNPQSPISLKSTKVPSPNTRSSHKLPTADKNVHNKQSSKSVNHSQKTSPKQLQNGSHKLKINSCVNFDKELLLVGSRSPPTSPKLSSSSSRGSSRPSSPPSRPNSPPCIRKSRSSKKSPIVLVDDFCKNNLKSNLSMNGALNDYEEEVLFLSGDWLPPLPSLNL